MNKFEAKPDSPTPPLTSDSMPTDRPNSYINDFGGLVTDTGHASDEMVIEMSNVSKWYGDFQVLTDCTAHVHRGDVVVVCGPSGSGKSTLIKTVNALEPFQKGEIFVNGIAVGDSKTDLPKLRSRVGMVFQHFELFPHLSIIDNLTVAQIKVLGRSDSVAQQKAMAYLDRVGLSAQKIPRRTVRRAAATCCHCPSFGNGPGMYVIRRAYLSTGS
nr:ATP-binding cassette domain-containing protein [Psychrobacter sp. PraFG1]UNK06012.1 ATP-binding cassette domain-containing protein [Psychrobacter sp. PraFG1]